MPSRFAQALAQARGHGGSNSPFAQALQANRVGKFERFVTEAGGRAASIARLFEKPWASPFGAALALNKKIREVAGIADPLEPLIEAEKALPPAQTFGEKAAGFAGTALPDIALGIATGPVAGIGTRAAAAGGAGRFLAELAGQGLQSAALAPVEFATRPAGQAALGTVAAPVAGTLLNRGLARVFGRGAAEAVPTPTEPAGALPGGSAFDIPPPSAVPTPVGPDQLPLPLSTPLRSTSGQMDLDFNPFRSAIAEQIGESPYIAPGISAPSGQMELPLEGLPAAGGDFPFTNALRTSEASSAMPPIKTPVAATKNLRTYYVTPEGKILRNKMEGTVKVRASSGAEARLRWQEAQQAAQADPNGVRGLIAQLRASLGMTGPPPSPDPVDPAMALFREQARIREMERISLAALKRKAIPSELLMDLGDEDIKQATQEGIQALRESAAEALSKAGVPSEEAQAIINSLEETGQKMPPVMNREIADIIEGLPKDAAQRFMRKMKGQQVCPL